MVRAGSILSASSVRNSVLSSNVVIEEGDRRGQRADASVRVGRGRGPEGHIG